jgi:hypothetical protein
MQFRDHPKIKPQWPPAWTFIGGSRIENSIGEEGTLVRVVRSQVAPTALFLLMKDAQAEYIGSLSFDDPDFCENVYIALRLSISSTIGEIGDRDLTPFL